MTAPIPVARTAWLLGVAVAYVAAARLGLALDPVGGFATLVWPPTGIALAALVRRGSWLWPAVAVGAFIANLWGGASWQVAMGIALGNTLEAVLGASLLRNVRGYDGAIGRVGDAFGLLTAALISPVVSASIGALSLELGGVVSAERMGDVWQAWWLGDVLGALVVAPVLLKLGRKRDSATQSWASGRGGWTRARHARERSAVLLGNPAAPLQRPHMIFPALVWAAIRFGPRTAALSVLVVSSIATVLVVSEVGPFVAPTLHENLTALQGFMGTAALTSLFLAAVSAERTRAARTLAEQHARLQAIAESSPDSIFVKDLQGRYVFVNPAHGRVLGSDPGAALGKSDADFFSQEVAQRLRETDSLAARSQQGSVCEEVVVVNGERRTFLSAKAPYRVAGEVAGSIGIACDITEQKNAERRLEDAVHARDEFLSIAGHELKTPLAALTLQVTGLQRTMHKPGTADDARRRQLDRVDRAVAQIRRLTRLVDDLLDVSRIAGGRIRLNREDLDLSQIAQQAASGLQDQAARSGCDVQVTARVPVTGAWDRARVERVLTNLITSALKHRAGNRVEVIVEASESAVLRIGEIGVAPEELERILERATAGALEQHQQSLGMTFLVVRQVVTAHGGTIRVESAPGAGSTVIVELPR